MRKQKIIHSLAYSHGDYHPLEGGYTVQIGDDLVHLNESDIIFIASGVTHRLIAPDTGKRLILQIEWLCLK